MSWYKLLCNLSKLNYLKKEQGYKSQTHMHTTPNALVKQATHQTKIESL
jgi:hypothetical protein